MLYPCFFIWRNSIWRTIFGETLFGKLHFAKPSFGEDWLRQSIPWLPHVVATPVTLIFSNGRTSRHTNKHTLAQLYYSFNIHHFLNLPDYMDYVVTFYFIRLIVPNKFKYNSIQHFKKFARWFLGLGIAVNRWLNLLRI